MLIVVTGPESSGKSSLAAELARRRQYPLIPERAREYLAARSGYEPSDLLAIADLQQASERSLAAPLAIADTDLQVIYLWWRERFGPVPASISRPYARQSNRHYLLCRPDLAWQPDPLRENPADRDRLFEAYLRDLKARSLSFDVIEGVGEARTELALQALSRIESEFQ